MAEEQKSALGGTRSFCSRIDGEGQKFSGRLYISAGKRLETVRSPLESRRLVTLVTEPPVEPDGRRTRGWGSKVVGGRCSVIEKNSASSVRGNPDGLWAFASVGKKGERATTVGPGRS